MKLRNAQRRLTCMLGLLLLLWNEQVFAQQPHSVAASNVSDVKVKPAATAPILLNDLVLDPLRCSDAPLVPLHSF